MINSDSDTLVVIPNYNDWESVSRLISTDKSTNISFLIVDDGSTESINQVQMERLSQTRFSILHLVRNQGHQRAIALGLSWAYHNRNEKTYAIMDGDGEDKVESLLVLIDDLNKRNDDVILFGGRKKRSESFGFKLGYVVYKVLFKTLSNQDIQFGHFCVFPRSKLKSITSLTEIWNHFPAAIIKSRIPFDVLLFDRGARIDGSSKMNLNSLIIHGLSAISVFNEQVGINALRWLFKSILIVILIAMGVTGVKVLTPLAVPGWASSIVLLLVTIIIQLMSIALIFVFQLLGNRTQNHFLPIKDYSFYIDRIENYHDKS